MDSASSLSSRPVRVRMAPSPTGYFHVGTARTALFNFLFARHHGGAFVLRIEDTDQARNDEAFERVIFEALEWLGLSPNEGPAQGGPFGPYRQSERFELYRQHARALEEKGLAYRAYETPEELAAMREEQKAAKQAPRYNGAHRDLSPQQRQEFEAQGRKGVLRLRVPEGETSWKDAVYGEVKWKNTELDDFVIQKGDGGPTYNFACVVDDALMQISHVIRGEDGLSNTPRQVLLYKALGFDEPVFAHLPFLLSPTRKKLSKRDMGANLLENRDAGIAPEAMISYLALLGWNPGGGDTQELFSMGELVEKFSLEGVNKAGAIFDPEKLAWMNVQWLKSLPIDEFIALARPHLESVLPEETDAYTRRAIELARERIRQLSDIRAGALPFFADEFPLDEAAAKKHLTSEAKPRLAALREKLAALPEWSHDAIEGAVRTLAEELGVKPAQLIHPSRLAVSGTPVGPSMFELLEALGRERVLARLARTEASLSE
jgi:glutamyl-tRNA synthetase